MFRPRGPLRAKDSDIYIYIYIHIYIYIYGRAKIDIPVVFGHTIFAVRVAAVTVDGFGGFRKVIEHIKC